jgi:ribosome-interacting GTPase 1
MKKIHHDIEFTVLRKKINRVGSIDEKISLLEQLVTLNPRNPRNLTLKRRYKEELESLRVKKGGKRRIVLSPYDAIHYKRQVALIGETNTGKSTLFNRLTGSDALVQDSPYTTYRPEVKMMDYKDVSIQVVEVPAIYAGDSDSAKYRFMRNSDVLCLCVRAEEDCDSVVRQMEKYFIGLRNLSSPSDKSHKNRPNNEPVEIPAFVASWTKNISRGDLVVADINDIEFISERIYSLLNIKRIYLVRHGEIKEKPLVFPADKEIKVSDFVYNVDKRILGRFKRARVVHDDMTIPEVQAAGLDYKLDDGDTVEIISA